jgi:drug/metabolite transporter (DMT)-like permease
MPPLALLAQSDTLALGERTGSLALIGAALILGGVALELRRR